jgi:iron(III) transport system ATP-binding protein
MYMADRILVMDEGRIVQSGAPAEVYLHPLNAFIAALFGPINRIPGMVRGGRIETPLGTFDAPGMADGAEAELLIRPEGLRLVPGGTGQLTARVAAARLLGRSSHLRVRLPQDEAASPVYLLVRAHGVFLPEVGTMVDVGVDPGQAFVFPVPNDET